MTADRPPVASDRKQFVISRIIVTAGFSQPSTLFFISSLKCRVLQWPRCLARELFRAFLTLQLNRNTTETKSETNKTMHRVARERFNRNARVPRFLVERSFPR